MVNLHGTDIVTLIFVGCYKEKTTVVFQKIHLDEGTYDLEGLELEAKVVIRSSNT